ncbi:uncharacterized protein LOC132549024 [Ylistrum balloti]|uniref:uncharacterized protein LOC132549024 n=1 Tax=Ylistrum balloti TaxID=509963 RepID=UPI002905CC37|nr:uncharacterized protein LOC132549024 [Ylistrum balloti]
MSSRSGSSDDFDTWEVVRRESSNERDLEDSDSDSSIEVVSVDTDVECEPVMPSSPSLGARQISPVFVLRVPSTEAVMDDSESDESADEVDDPVITKALQVSCHRQDEEILSVGGGNLHTPQEHVATATSLDSGGMDITHGRHEETDTEPVSSVDFSSSNISVTSLSIDTEHTEDTSQSGNLDGSNMVETEGSRKSCSSVQSLDGGISLVDTTLTYHNSTIRTDEDSASRTDEDCASRTDEDSASMKDEDIASRTDENIASRTDENIASTTDEDSACRTEEDSASRTDEGGTLRTDEDSASRTDEDSAIMTENIMAAEHFPSLSLEPDSISRITDPVESSKHPSKATEDGKESDHVPDITEEDTGHIDDEVTTKMVLEEPQEGYTTDLVQPYIENMVPNPPLDDAIEKIDQADVSADSVLTQDVQLGSKDSKNTGKAVSDRYILVIILIASLSGFLMGSGTGALWITRSIHTQLTAAHTEIANTRQQLSAHVTEMDFLQQSLSWMTENASFDYESLLASDDEMVFDPKFTAGYDYQHYLFTFGKYDETKRELVRRNKLTVEEIQQMYSAEWMDKVNRLEQEKADLVQQIGMMKYRSPSNPDVSGEKVLDKDEGQDFSWFSSSDQDLQAQGHTGQSKTKENRCRSEGTTAALEQEDKIAVLETDLQLEKARSDRWQSMYLQQKKSAESKTCSGKDFLNQFGEILQNFSVPEDFSENVKDKWEIVKNQSLEGWQLIMDMASIVTSGTKQQYDVHQTPKPAKSSPFKDDRSSDTGPDKDDLNGEDQEDFSSKENKEMPVPKWKNTIEDVYNKTKTSMSDVSQQIKQTWEQVKNLSQDLWKEHEPSVTKLREKMSKKVEKVTEKLNAWFTRRRAHGHKGHQWKASQKSNEETSSQTGSTKRRNFTKLKEEEKNWTKDNEEKEDEEIDDDDDDVDEDDEEKWGHSDPVMKWYHRKFSRFRTKIDKLNLQKFLKMNRKHMRKVFKRIENFVRKFDMQVLSPQNRKWLTCQLDWWFGMSADVKKDPNCRDMLQCWQVKAGGDPSGCDSSHYSDQLHKGHQQKGGKRHLNNQGQGREDKAKKQFHGSPHRTDDSHYQDDNNRRERFEEEENSDPIEDPTPFCDHASGDCPTSEPSWYIRQLKHREEMRRIVAEETEPGSQSDWMFTRAEDRDFQRTLPDDWYLQRLDSTKYRDNGYFDEE